MLLYSQCTWLLCCERKAWWNVERRDLEELTLNEGPTLQQWLYDGWVVRFADGQTSRASSVDALYPALHAPEAE